MESIEKIEKLTPAEASKILGTNPETIRAGLRSERFDFGSAIPPKKPGGKWNYIIIKSKFLKYVGIN